MLPFLLVYLFVFNYIQLSNTLQDGAPLQACYTKLPFHGGGIPPQNSPSPFHIETSALAVSQGQVLQIEIQSNPPELQFGGFIIHALTTSPPHRVVGRFAPSSDNTVKLIGCAGDDDTATHVSPAPKNNLVMQWQAPNDFIGEVIFNATVAQSYYEFWVGIVSEPVQIVQRGVSIPPQPGISTTRRPILPTAPIFVPETIRPQLKMDPMYDGCGLVKTCFGFPDGCVTSQSCRAFITAAVFGERYEFEMKSGYNNPAYIAIGLSSDDKMGDDSIMECIPEGGTIRAYTSWTNPRPNLGVTRDGVPQGIIRLIDGSFVDGTIYCKIERQSTAVIKGVSFDLPNNQYNLLVAIGSSLKENSVGYHDLGKLASAQRRSLADVGPIAGASNLLLRLHGAFMLTAWIGTASIGILLARYFKQTWVGNSLCGKDEWFAWHRICMVTTWSLTMAAFVIIFVQIGGWSSEQNPHAILGTLTTILCFIQPIGALFRPAPNHKNRPYFNWIHWFIGNLAHILAIVTIFFAVKLTKAELPEWFDWILVAYVAFHVLMHIIFSIAGCLSDKTYNERITTFPMTDVSATRGGVTVRKMDAPYSGLRKILLTVYLVILILLVIALVVIAVLAPIEDTVQSLKTKLTN